MLLALTDFLTSQSQEFTPIKKTWLYNNKIYGLIHIDVI